MKEPSEILWDIRALKYNWSGDDGDTPVTAPVVEKAERLLSALNSANQKVWHFCPGPNGEIMIDLRSGIGSVEILFYPNESRYVLFPTDGRPEQHPFTDDDLPKILEWLNRK